VAIKLERRTEQRVMLMYMVLEGISMLGQKRSPSFIRETLNSFVAQYEDEIHSPSLEEIEERVEAETVEVPPPEREERR
jgi:chemotaxis protein MotA